jgi:hypothetical protein
MSEKKKKTYTPAPQLTDGDLRNRYAVMLRVLTGALTVSDGARELGMSRNHFQTLMHKGLHGFVDGLSPKVPGRPSRPEAEQKLRDENTRMRRENEKLLQRVETIERMLGAASDLLRKPSRPRTKRAAKTTTAAKGSSDDEERLGRAAELRAMGLNAPLVAALAGMAASTLRRWRARGVPKRTQRPRAPVDRGLATCVEEHVRSLRGLVGAESIRHAVPGISRRQAAAIKRDTLTAMERERVASVERIVVTTPGVVRGFDQMYVETTQGQQLLLFSADGAVPYRTSVLRTESYDEASVAAAVAEDFARHGAPLVWRADRHRSHDTPEVRAVLEAHGVLRLSGPPHHPGFYGQTERQNREHRAWLDALGIVDPDVLDDESRVMLDALNCSWKRPTLDWRTSHEAWLSRPDLKIDRSKLRDDVAERAERIRRDLDTATATTGLTERLAIQQMLTKRGLLNREAGGWC